MKKKDDKKQYITLDFLEQKYKAEKEILLKDNRQLQQQLNQEIQANKQLTLNCEKLKQTAQLDNDELRRQNQQLNARILELQKLDESKCESQEEQLENLQHQKALEMENQTLLKEIRQLEDVIVKMDREKKELDLQYRNNETELKEEFEILDAKHAEFKRETNRQMEELVANNQQLQEDCDKLTQKLAEQKNKKKETERKLEQLQKRLRESEQMQEQRQYQQTESLREERDRLHERNIELNTKLTLLQANLQQKDDFISRIEMNQQEVERKTAQQREQLQEYRNKVDRLHNECCRLEEQCSRLREEKNEEAEKVTRSIDDTVKEMRKKMREQLISLIKNNDQQLSQKNLQRFMQGVTIRENIGQGDTVVMQQEKPLSVVKLESQINTLEAEIIQYRKEQERMNFEINKMRKQAEERQYELEKKEQQLRDQRNRMERAESERARELLALRNQNHNLKHLQTEKLELIKEHQEYDTAMSLKLAFYERKIKEHLDTIDRKESIIEKLKIFRTEAEEKQRNYDENVRKLSEEAELLKRFKQDCNRKQELIRDYKTKIQKLKQELEEMRGELTQSKKDRQRIEKQLESKEQYLATIKTRQEKQPVQHSEETTRLKQLKDLRSSYESKLKHLRREKEELRTALQQVRITVLDKVEEYVARSIPSGRRKTQQYEAAKLLGLKAGELQEFLNPGTGANRKITSQLQSLWQDGNFGQFIHSFTEYLATQQPVRNDLLI